MPIRNFTPNSSPKKISKTVNRKKRPNSQEKKLCEITEKMKNELQPDLTNLKQNLTKWGEFQKSIEL